MLGNKRVIKFLSCLLVFVVFFQYISIYNVAAKDDIQVNLKENLIEIETLDMDSGFSDLIKLKSNLENKTIIALGESTIGAKEFYLLKSRMTKFLIEEMGYRLFAIDGNFANIEIVNEYINGNGDIEDALWELKPFPWSPQKLKEDKGYRIDSHTYLAPFTTDDFKSMLLWMKDYNKTAQIDEKIKVYGIGFDNPDKSVERLIEYIIEVDKDKGKIYKKKLKDLLMVHSLNFKYPESRPLGLLFGMIEELNEDLNYKSDEYIKKSSLEQYEIAIKDIETTMQWIRYRGENLKTGIDNAVNIREEELSNNVKWILDRESKNGNDKIIVWSHNKNISKDTKNYTSMGKHLYDEFNDNYYALGLDFFKGKFRAYTVDIWGSPTSNFIYNFNIDKSKPKYLVDKLQKANMPISFLDFKSASEDESIGEILNTEQLFHSIYTMYPGKYTPSSLLPYWTKQYVEEVPIKSYDGFLFVSEISSTKGLHDERDTKAEDGDKEIINHYRDIVVGQIGTILSVLLVIVLVILWLIKKYKKIKYKKGSRYPGSSRWD